ncbi:MULTISPECIES: matrixin family metalloprotease [unclassified Streptomyces]|uniref:matrixin family metalloprotease n=1 Tax=unclassified Streptomyces TaxID=2593676 RepID=UPI002E2FCF4C|nr:matrixin family metalloprotease [Streptomyces sp. NBC_01268]
MLSQVTAPVISAVVLALATVNAPYGAVAPAAAPCVSGESETRADSAVDEGEIRWTETSKYDSQRTHAITEWNKLRTINIAPDAVNTVNDLEFRDYSKNNDTAAYYERHGGIAQTDYIYLNKHWLDGAYKNEPAFQKNIVLHELGHALGLCHKADTVDSVMRKAASPKTVPTAVDVANIRKIWG